MINALMKLPYELRFTERVGVHPSVFMMLLIRL